MNQKLHWMIKVTIQKIILPTEKELSDHSEFLKKILKKTISNLIELYITPQNLFFSKL